MFSLKNLPLVLFITCFTSLSHAWMDNRTLFNDTIEIQSYIKDPVLAIRTGMDRYKWRVKSQEKGKIRARLAENEREIILDITYSDKEINFTPVSDARIFCTSQEDGCRVEEKYYRRWRLNLRKGITRALHEAAIKDAYYAFLPSAESATALDKEIQRYAIEFKMKNFGHKEKSHTGVSPKRYLKP